MPAARSSRNLGEFELLAKVRAAVEGHGRGRGRGVVVGIGDDCAVVRTPGALQVLTTDTMVEGVHFRGAWLTARELGVRSFRAAVSDIAAMGALPRHVLLSLELPRTGFGSDSREALALVRALAVEARRCGAALVGGNVSGGPRAAVTVTVTGEPVAAPVLRRGARPGDLVFVTGALGGAAAGWRALSAPTSLPSSRPAASAWKRPPVRLDFAAELARRGLVRAMVDLSDGLLQDLGHLADESGVAIVVDADAVPVHRAAYAAARTGRSSGRRAPGSGSPASRGSAGGRLAPGIELALTGGEDYELAFAASPRSRAAIEAAGRRLRVPVSVVGFVQEGRAAVTDLDGEPFTVSAAGFDHLRRRAARTTKAR